MTVRELIEKLQALPPEWQNYQIVMSCGAGWEIEDIGDIEIETFRSDEPDKPDIRAVIMRQDYGLDEKGGR